MTGPTPRGARRAKDRVTPAAIVDAAISVLERDGASAMTMRAVASELGVSPGVMYWHIGDRDELLNAMARRWSEELVSEPDTTGPWTDQLTQVLEQARLALVSRPELLDVLSAELQSLVLSRVRTAVFEVLSASGADEHHRQLFTRWLMFHLVGTVRNERSFNAYLTESTGATPISRADSDEFFTYTTSVLLQAIRTEIETSTAP